MLTYRRVLLAVVALVVLAAAYTAWLAWRTERDLHDAQQAVDDLRSAIQAGDDDARDRAISTLTTSAASAHGHTSGFWWGATTHLPFVGDDTAGVRDISASVQMIADDAVNPLISASDNIDGVMHDGQVDLAKVRALDLPVSQAAAAMRRAHDVVADDDSSGYVSLLRTRFDEYAATIDSLQRSLTSADRALEVLPTMLGDGGPRNYLLVFQNNAEIRATGGLSGSWALIHADHGKIELTKQGSDTDFPAYTQPVTPITAEEKAVYGLEIGRFFQDPGFTPDFPRAAQLFNGFWAREHPDQPLDGVIALDPVTISYLLEGIGSVPVDGVTLTPENAVSELLNGIYLREKNPKKQDAFFQDTTKDIFDRVTGTIPSPLKFAQGLARAATEGRFLVAPFDAADAATLQGTRVTGALSGDDGTTPHIDVGLNDATASKMSYYLRYGADVTATSCDDGRQTLVGSVRLSQTISPTEAAKLPTYITGTGVSVKRGDQFVFVRIYGPYGGSLQDFMLDGKRSDVQVKQLQGRPVAIVYALVDKLADSRIDFTATTAPGQVGDVEVGMTPSVVPGDRRETFTSAC